MKILITTILAIVFSQCAFAQDKSNLIELDDRQIDAIATAIKNPVIDCVCLTNSDAKPIMQLGRVATIQECRANEDKLIEISNGRHSDNVQYAATMACNPRLSSASFLANQPKSAPSYDSLITTMRQLQQKIDALEHQQPQQTIVRQASPSSSDYPAHSEPNKTMDPNWEPRGLSHN